MVTSPGEIQTAVAFREKLSSQMKLAVIAMGAALIALSVITLPSIALTPGYAFMLAFCLFVAPRTTLTLPRSKFAISFSDSLIFLAFLLYGGEAAIVLSAAETLANCLYLRRQLNWGRLMIPTNVAITVLATAVTYAVWLALPVVFGVVLNLARTQNLIVGLGILAVAQFLVSSFLAAVFHCLKDGVSLWLTWKKYCFSSSLTQIVGAALAGIVFKLINYGDLMTAVIALIAIAVAFLNYRQSIGEINDAIRQVEEAERLKAETERHRRLEAEGHARELGMSLEKEERANDALRKSEKDLQHAALHDNLTGLANRRQLGDVLRRSIEEYKRDPSNEFQVLFLDIRSFKNINDTLGHSTGDKVLMIAAKRFVRMLNPGDLVARTGGDEFAIVLQNLDSVTKAQKVARRIYQSITQPFSLSGNKIAIDVNIGIAPCDAEYNTPEEILRDADIAMHYAKERQGGPAVFTRELRARFLERVKLEMDLHHAIARGELSMRYQPIVSLSDNRLVGFEALLRWRHSDLGMIPPNKFIPLAEQSGLIKPITVWVLEQTCMNLSRWQTISSKYEDLMISVNISGRHLSNDDLISDVGQILTSTRLDPRSLKLEVTESSAMENPEQSIRLLNKLKQLGVRLSIDDFGTGYSSLSYLHRLPFDTLKIDRSFVSSVGDNGENSEILQTIISLAKNLKMRVIAEGIETPSQLAVLRNLGCDFGQGFLLAKPKTKEEAERILYESPDWISERGEVSPEKQERETAEEHLPVF